jgi:protein O-mannosyl-transferase
MSSSLIKKTELWIFIFALAGTSLYFQTTSFSFAIDDGIYTFNNAAVDEGLRGIHKIFAYGSLNFLHENSTNSGIYRPITLLSFAFEKGLCGDFNPAVGHTLNVILYFLVLVLLGFILLRIFRKSNETDLIPLLILLIYAVHPLHVEVVASIKSRDTLLSAFFSFLAIYLWLNHLERVLAFSEQLKKPRHQQPKLEKPGIWISKRGSTIISVLIGFMFALGLLSKEESLTLIAVVILIGYFFFKLNWVDSLINAFPFIITGFVYLGVRFYVLDPNPNHLNSILNSVVFGAEGPDRLATNLYIYLYYLRLLMFPHPLSWDYSFSQIPIKSMADPWVIVSLTVFITAILLGLKSLRNKSIIGFGILFYLVTFSIFSNFTESIAIGATIGERFMFIPSLGFSIVLVYGLHLLLMTLNLKNSSRVLISLLIPFVLLLGVKTHAYSRSWESLLSIKEAGASAAPKSWRTQIFYADELRRHANHLRDDPESAALFRDSIDGIFRRAVKYYEAGFAILENRPERPELHYPGLSECYLYLGDTVNAIKTLNLQVKLNTSFFYPHFVLGVISYNRGDFVAAIDHYRRALSADSPDLFQTHRNLGLSFLRLGRDDEAINSLENALAYGSSQTVINNLTSLYAKKGNNQKLNELLARDESKSNAEKTLLLSIARGRAAFSNSNYREVIELFRQVNLDFNEIVGYRDFQAFIDLWARSHMNINEVSLAKEVYRRVIMVDPESYHAYLGLGNIAFHSEKTIQKPLSFIEHVFSWTFRTISSFTAI